MVPATAQATAAWNQPAIIRRPGPLQLSRRGRLSASDGQWAER